MKRIEFVIEGLPTDKTDFLFDLIIALVEWWGGKTTGSLSEVDNEKES